MGHFDGLFSDTKGFSNGYEEGKDFYMSPDGYRIMTEEFLIRRGYCCAGGCKHCPYWPKAQKGNTILREK
jgi:hypothetical protein